jgi:hypothetical protein
MESWWRSSCRSSCDALELGDLDLLVDGLDELLAVDHELVDADAALVAGAAADGQPLGLALKIWPLQPMAFR